MSYITMVMQFIIAIPKLIKFWREMKNVLDENSHDKAMDKLKSAKDEQEQKDATRDLANNL